jgi:phosphoribosyl 1,2-cyclic phosphodiesterase
LFSGSTGNCSLVATQSTRLLVDAGVGAVQIRRTLEDADISLSAIDGILLTHEHIDHIRAVGVLTRRWQIPVYANMGTWRAILAQNRLGDIPADCRVVFDTGQDFYIGDIGIRSFPICHDTAEPVGFSLCSDGRQVCVATDLGTITEPVMAAMRGADAVLLEANHDVDMLKNGPYPAVLKRRILGDHGHLSNICAGNAVLQLLKSGVRRVALGHLSQQNNTPEVAWHTVADLLAAEGVALGRDITVEMTWPDRPGATWVL